MTEWLGVIGETSNCYTICVEDISTMRQLWEHELQGSKPYLFNLAWQIIDAYPHRAWNLLICDDNGGRLPFLFVRTLLERAGYEIPVAYLAAGNRARAATSQVQYQEYVKGLLRPLSQPRVLFVTESAGTFGALRYVHSLIEPLGQVDFAVVASQKKPPQTLGRCFVGGYGITMAAHHIYQTFEAPKLSTSYVKVKAEGHQGHILTNLLEAPVPGEPYGHESNDPQFRELATFASKRMVELADEYWETEGPWHQKAERGKSRS